jgi:hypothetical protein
VCWWRVCLEREGGRGRGRDKEAVCEYSRACVRECEGHRTTHLDGVGLASKLAENLKGLLGQTKLDGLEGG